MNGWCHVKENEVYILTQELSPNQIVEIPKKIRNIAENAVQFKQFCVSVEFKVQMVLLKICLKRGMVLFCQEDDWNEWVIVIAKMLDHVAMQLKMRNDPALYFFKLNSINKMLYGRGESFLVDASADLKLLLNGKGRLRRLVSEVELVLG